MSFKNLAPILNNLSILVIDVDGVITHGGIEYNSQGEEAKTFDVKDGLGLVMLRYMGILTAIITGRKSQIVEKRASELGIDFVLQGFPMKLPAYAKLKDELHLPDAAFGFVGDDLIDLDVMLQAGFSAAPADAHPAAKKSAHYVCRNKGGSGAIREIADMIFAFRRAEFGPQNFIPIQLLEHWQDVSWESLTANSHTRK